MHIGEAHILKTEVGTTATGCITAHKSGGTCLRLNAKFTENFASKCGDLSSVRQNFLFFFNFKHKTP